MVIIGATRFTPDSIQTYVKLKAKGNQNFRNLKLIKGLSY